MRQKKAAEPQRDMRSFVDRLARQGAVKLSRKLTVDGLKIVGDKGTDKIVEALGLIRDFDPVRYRRLLRDVGQILVTVLPASVAQWAEASKACELDERYLIDDARTAEHVASTIVHEATHARLMRCGIGYEEEIRDRVERVCLRREIAFAARLPIGADAAQRAEANLEAMPDFSDKAMRERHLDGLRDALLYLNMPVWLVSLMVSYRRWQHRRRVARRATG
ncbi:hypothetical protein DPM33_28045 [Mesorhizobium hawassense]|uniref:Uncharacterized protein n=1 Tax=Mesorhizobium hawassense TaxID=1209954 RepID=A0A330HE81_9HYPH|nr:hypothetical protein [Mesorhizobium hawassense]RAZ86665.1 hypothetical protein DPM33_28045 [Mesorhizobium hawassense]